MPDDIPVIIIVIPQFNMAPNQGCRNNGTAIAPLDIQFRPVCGTVFIGESGYGEFKSITREMLVSDFPCPVMGGKNLQGSKDKKHPEKQFPLHACKISNSRPFVLAIDN
jgi:hypothetical protein